MTVVRWSADVRGPVVDAFGELVAEEEVSVPADDAEKPLLGIGLSYTQSGTPAMRLDTVTFAPPSFSTAGAGHSLVRLINWADGVGSVIVRHRRELSCVASDVHGVGH